MRRHKNDGMRNGTETIWNKKECQLCFVHKILLPCIPLYLFTPRLHVVNYNFCFFLLLTLLFPRSCYTFSWHKEQGKIFFLYILHSEDYTSKPSSLSKSKEIFSKHDVHFLLLSQCCENGCGAGGWLLDSWIYFYQNYERKNRSLMNFLEIVRMVGKGGTGNLKSYFWSWSYFPLKGF